MASEPATTVELELEEEQQLVEEAHKGNLDAMRPILERYAAPLYGTVILPRLGDAASAEEVLRDTLATAVEKIRRFTWQGKSIARRGRSQSKVYDSIASRGRAGSPTRWPTRSRSSQIPSRMPTHS